MAVELEHSKLKRQEFNMKLKRKGPNYIGLVDHGKKFGFYSNVGRQFSMCPVFPTDNFCSRLSF